LSVFRFSVASNTHEIILFSQNGGLQQILIFHEQGDTYANQISERVLNLSIKIASK
jgi:hypothetical protein